MNLHANLHAIMQPLLNFDPEGQILENACLCEFSAEDSTPTLHITLWRGYDLGDLPDTGLEIVAEGFSDIGRTYSLQSKN